MLEPGAHLVFPKNISDEVNEVSLVVVRKGLLLEAALGLGEGRSMCQAGERQGNLVNSYRRYKDGSMQEHGGPKENQIQHAWIKNLANGKKRGYKSGEENGKVDLSSSMLDAFLGDLGFNL